MPVEVFDELPGSASSGGLTEILRNITSSLRFPPYGEDPAAFSGDVKVTAIRDSDGEQVLEEEVATKVAAADGDIDHYVVEIPGTSVPEVDRLEVVWTDGASTYTTTVEVVGGFVASLASIKKKLHKEDVAEEDLAEAREIALRSIEDACGVAFRRRYEKQKLDGSGSEELFLRQPHLLRVIAATVNGVAIGVEDLIIDPVGIVIGGSWPAGRQNVEIAYAHGIESFPPAGLPVRDLAAHLLATNPTNWNERATSYTSGEVTYSLVTAGIRGAEFPLPSVNAFVEQHQYPSVG